MDGKQEKKVPAYTRLSEEQVTRKFGECTHPHREALHTRTCLHIPL